jgi:hypothetical protein
MVMGFSFLDGGTICSIRENSLGIYISRPRISPKTRGLGWKFGPHVPDTLRMPRYFMKPWTITAI